MISRIIASNFVANDSSSHQSEGVLLYLHTLVLTLSIYHVTRAPNPSGKFNCYYSFIFTQPRKSYRILVTVKYYLETFL